MANRYPVDISEYRNNAPILKDKNPNSFGREYNFKWILSKASQAYSWMSAANNTQRSVRTIINDVKNIKDLASITRVVTDSIAAGKMAAAYTTFEVNVNLMIDLVNDKVESISLPDDEIEIDNYPLGNTNFSVPTSKRMGDITVTYVDDKYNNVYNFHKIWQECLRPGSDLCFMDIPSFSICGVYETSNYKQSTDELSELYQNDKEPNRHSTGKTVYPALFPKKINRSNADANSSQFSKVTVTYVRTPIITKTLPVTQISYSGQATISSAISSWLS
jgi:hypothetical protein